MKHLLTFIFILYMFSLTSAQADLKNNIDVQFGYGGTGFLSNMTFLSIGYGKQIKNGFVLKGSFLKGSGAEKNSSTYKHHGSINIYGIGLHKAVNTSGASSINLGLGYKMSTQKIQTIANLGVDVDESHNELNGKIIHGVDADLSYLHNFNDRLGIYGGANFTTGIFMFSVNLGSRIYF